MKSRYSLFTVICFALPFASCGPEDTAPTTESNDKTYQVTATVGMITDIVREVAGDHAQVEGIIGEGVDPHLYKPTSLDVKALQAADVAKQGLVLAL